MAPFKFQVATLKCHRLSLINAFHLVKGEADVQFLIELNNY